MPLFCTVTKAFVTSPMPWTMSMLVLHPNMTRFTDKTGEDVNVSVGGAAVNVGVKEGVAVFSGVTGEMTVTFDDGVEVATKTGGGIMKGVGVRMPGVEEEIAVQTGNGWGATLQPSHELVHSANKRKKINFHIFPLYTCE